MISDLSVDVPGDHDQLLLRHWPGGVLQSEDFLLKLLDLNLRLWVLVTVCCPAKIPLDVVLGPM